MVHNILCSTANVSIVPTYFHQTFTNHTLQLLYHRSPLSCRYFTTVQPWWKQAIHSLLNNEHQTFWHQQQRHGMAPPTETSYLSIVILPSKFAIQCSMFSGTFVRMPYVVCCWLAAVKSEFHLTCFAFLNTISNKFFLHFSIFVCFVFFPVLVFFLKFESNGTKLKCIESN